jgi:PAS domain S-box-containing protein
MNSNAIKNLQKVMQIDPSLRAGDYLKQFCKNTSKFFEFQYILIATPNRKNANKVETIIAVADGEVVDNFSYDLADTPCENVASGNRVCTHHSGVAEQFPKDLLLTEMNVAGYSGAPLHDRNGDFIGLFVILDTKPLPEGIDSIIEILASRVGFELEREIELFSFYNYQTNLEKFLLISNTDAEGKITKVNDKFCEVSGYTREELIGKDHRLVNSGEHSKEFIEKLWKTLQNGGFWEGEICNKAKDGSKYWVNSFMFPLYKKQEIVGYSSIRFEVTKRKEMEKSLDQEREKMAFTSQLASIGELSAGIGHEISNPLSIISASTNLLAKKIGLEDEKVQTSIDRILKSTERINKIIKGLHYLSQGSRLEQYQEESFNEILENTLGFCEETLKTKQIKLRYNKLEHDFFFNCNGVKISQVLLNLINNAKDSIDDASPKERWISLEFDNSEDWFKIYVKDSGPGISKENRDKVMRSFFTTKKIGKGSGLGLSLVKRFVEEHAGIFKICDQSDVSCFVIEFPKKVAKAA